MNSLTEQAAAVLLAVVGVAILAVLVSQKSNTAGVLSAFGTAFSGILGTAVSPVTGATGGLNTSFNPTNFGFNNNMGWPQ